MLEGIVIHGESLGRTLGYPTANLDVNISNVRLPDGVYAAWVNVQTKQYQGALVIMKERKKIEVHILDFSADVYGVRISVDPVQKVSEIEHTSTIEELQAKIQTDVQLVKEFFQDHP